MGAAQEPGPGLAARLSGGWPGKVLRAGKPVGGAAVELCDSPLTMFTRTPCESSTASFRATTAADGSFALPEVRHGITTRSGIAIVSERHGSALASDLILSGRFVSAEEGLAEFRRWSGLGPALDALGRNPLPAAIVIRPRAVEADPAAIDRLVEDLRALPEVEEVRFDGLWVRRYTSLLDALARLAELLGGLLALAVLLIIGNTVRLNVDSRRHEIDVLKRVGAEDAFVRRPFLYGGVWHGALGGLASLGLLDALVLLARGPVGRVAAAYGSSYQLSLPSAGLAALLVGGGALLGWVGAYAASHRQLRLMDPSEDDPVGRQQ